MEVEYCLLLGLGVGLISSFLGVGGGILIVPLLPSILPMSPKHAVATSLFTVFLVSSKNVISFLQKMQFPWRAGASLGLGAGVASFAVSQLLEKVNDKVMLWVLCVVILAIGARLLFFRGKPSSGNKLDTEAKWSKRALGVGVGIGALVGFTGIGGGILFGPSLLWLGLVEDHQLSPTSNLAMMITCGAASLGFIYQADTYTLGQWGLIHTQAALFLFVGAWASSILGLRFQHKMQAKHRRWILAALLFVVLVKTILRISKL